MREAQWKSKDYAKKLRRDQTFAEKKLWAELRNKRLGGFKFRRQHPIGDFIIDFACLTSKLIIELDGPTHDSKEARDYDNMRMRVLERQGWTVIRYANDAVFDDMNMVLDDIALQLNLLQ